MLLGMCLIQSVEKEVKITETKWDNPNMIEMRYGTDNGFWLSSYLAGQSAKSITYWYGLKQALGFTEENYERMVKEFAKMAQVNRVLIGLLVGAAMMVLTFIGLFVGMVCIMVIGKGITFKEVY